MGNALPPRVIKSGMYIPTLARSGDIDGVIFRKRNLITRGRQNRLYEQAWSGLGNLDEPLDLVTLTGTLTLTADDVTVGGAGTAFLSELHLGQFIIGISGTQSWLLVVRRIDSDTSMVVWKAPADSVGGVVGFRSSVMFSINDLRGTALRGNALKLDRGSYLSVGDGTLRIDGSPLQGSSLSMTRAAQISIFDPLTGDYANYTLGMDTPPDPDSLGPSDPWGLAAVAGGSKGMQAGNYSMVICAARKETGGYNNPSARADVVIATGDAVATTFPPMDTANGQNAFMVWVTTYADTLGADLNYLNGPWHFLRMVTDDEVSPAGGTVLNLEWLDAEVETNEIVSFNNDPPTDAEFVENIGDIPVYISCQGQGYAAHPTATSPGPFIVPAKPNNIEAAPLELAFSSSPPETIIGVTSAQGRLYLLTYNHLQIAQSTPSDAVPIIIRPFWKDGFANPYQLVFVNGTLYGFPVAGPSRSVGDGDEIVAERDWAEDVAEIVLGDHAAGDGWNPGQVLVGYDPFNDAVIYFHAADRLNDAGFWTTRWLMYGISQGFWIGDGELSSNTQDMIVSGVATVGDRLDLIVGGRTGADVGEDETERFDAGTGSPWFLIPPISDSGNELRSKTIKSAYVIGKVTDASFKIYGYDIGDPVVISELEAGTNASTSAQDLPDTTNVAQSARKPVNVSNAVTHTIRVAGDCTGQSTLDRVDQITYEQAIMGVRR